MKFPLVAPVLLCMVFAGTACAESCTTQSRMQPGDRATLKQTAETLAASVAANDAAAVRSRTMPEYAQNFAGIANAIATIAPNVRNAGFQTQSLWLLDATDNKPGPDGKPVDVQFSCSLNQSPAAVNFSLPALPAGKYALAIVDAVQPRIRAQLAFLMKQDTSGTWQLAGFFPRLTTAAGHDGLWYWTAARSAAKNKQSWVAFVDYEEAEQLLKPVSFMTSTHLDQLHDEELRSAPTAMSGGIGVSTPLVIKAKDGTEYLLTAIGPDASLGNDRIDVAMHYSTDPLTDPAAARARNQKAAAALLGAYPELRENFHGVWVFAESQNTPPFASEEPAASLH